jgi:hypothetical protein
LKAHKGPAHEPFPLQTPQSHPGDGLPGPGQCARRRPETHMGARGVIASGYTDGLENNTKFDFEILSKPYRKQYLLDKIKKLFEKS